MAHGSARGAAAPKRRRWRRWWHALWVLPLLFAGLTLLQVVALRWLDPWGSMMMAERQLEVWLAGEARIAVAQRWVDYDALSPHLPIALVAAEDQQFPNHAGFDLEAIEKALAHNERGRRLRGGSTISQQVAKNVFLWSDRSWLRKGLEAWYTVLIEAFWGKRRILEVYANVAEFGDGVYGAELAAQRFFGKPASRLTAAEAARLAAVLPSPRRYSARAPGPYVQRRAAWIQRQARQLGGERYLEDCCGEP